VSTKLAGVVPLVGETASQVAVDAAVKLAAVALLN
jgi:hypothetical protein